MPAEVIHNTRALEAGLSTIVNSNGMFQDPDNAIVIAEKEAQLAGLPMTDADGRAIISWHQYNELGRLNADMSRYALRVYHTSPRVNGTWTIQASKLLKWWGLDYRPVGWANEKAARDREQAIAEATPTTRAEVQQAKNPTTDDDVTVFFCKDKFPECKRFFDTERGLEFHWTKEHGIKKTRATRKPPAPKTEE